MSEIVRGKRGIAPWRMDENASGMRRPRRTQFAGGLGAYLAPAIYNRELEWSARIFCLEVSRASRCGIESLVR